MSWTGLPPGNILQQMYLKERLKKLSGIYPQKRFLEIGSGNGHVSYVFLESGWQGLGIDLNVSACQNNEQLNKSKIHQKKYRVICDDFLKFESPVFFDVIISCMVIEHLPDHELNTFIQKALSLLSKDGTLIIQVPANMKFWNIEDDIAGHIKRYELKDIYNMASHYHLLINHIAALNYPLSNFLFRVSNYLVRKSESNKLNLSQKERTIYTGNRKVPLKTSFPRLLNILLNPIALYPFHILQKLYSEKYSDALVLYVEFTKSQSL